MTNKKLILSTLCVMLAGFGLNAAYDAPSVSDQTIQADATEADRELVKDIRQALTNDKTLSKHGQSVRVSAEDGTVTLQGYVASEKEKNSIANTVKQVHGVKSIDNQLKVVIK